MSSIQAEVPRGYSAFINDGSRIVIQNSFHTLKATQSYDTAIFWCISVLHYCMAAALVSLIPQFFYKFQRFTYQRALSKNSRLMCNSIFWGFTITSVIGLLIICERNVYIITALTKVSSSVYWWFILPVPVPLAIFCFFDIWSTYRNVFPRPRQLKSKCCQKCSTVCYFISVIMVTLFLQMVSFHSGWLMLLLITFPLQVGTSFCILLTLYIASVFNFGFTIRFCRKRNKGAPRKDFFDGMAIVNLFFLGIAYFLLSYYITMARYPHEDAITKLIPSILPLVFIGFCTWMVKKMSSEAFDHDEENPLDHNDDIKHKEVPNTITVQRYDTCLLMTSKDIKDCQV